MTNNNRRQLARVRNAFLGATALAGFAAAATPASAIVINNNLTPTQIIDPTNITGVSQMIVDEQNGFIGLCTATLINPRTVIFASHCVNENPAGNGFMNARGYGAAFGGLPISFGFQADNRCGERSWLGLVDTATFVCGVTAANAASLKYHSNLGVQVYNSNFVVYNTNCCTIGLGNNFLQSDVAMAALDRPAVGIPISTMLFSALSAPAHATIVGFGTLGTAASPSQGIDFKRRVAENIVSMLGSLDDQDLVLFGPPPDGLPANLYMSDFNDPKFNTAQANQFDFNIFHDVALTKEGITAPGDSGGPLIIDHQFAAPTIAAVLSGGDRFFGAQKSSSYGTTSFYQPLYLYWDWILANNPYKYVGAKAGNGLWTDVTHWQMNLDPAYLTVGPNNTLVNALPTTPAQGQADVPPGFGLVCFFNDCVNIKTGVETVNTPPATPGPFGVVSDPAQVPLSGPEGAEQAENNPFAQALGQAAFVDFVKSFVSSNGGASCAGGPALVSVASLNNDVSDVVASQDCVAQAGPGGDPGSSAAAPSPQSNWTNPEGTALAGGVQVQGAPGASPGQVPNDTDGNPTTGAPARYYDVTLSAAGITTLSGTAITVDQFTENGAAAQLTISAGASLTTLIAANSFAGTTQVDGTLTSTGANGVQMFGGVLQGTGIVTAPTINFLLGAVAPGTVGTIGTLTLNGTVFLGAGSTTVIDTSGVTSDLLKINGAATVGGTAVITPLTVVQQGASYTFLTATTITGAYNAVTDTLPGVLMPSVSKVNNGATQSEVVTFVAGSFVTLLGTSGTADQLQIAAGLDAARGAHYNDMIALFQLIDPLSGTALTQALENLVPDAERGASLVGEMQNEGFDGMIQQQLDSISGGGGGSTQAGLRVDGDGLKAALNSASGSSAQAQQFMAIGSSIATNPGGGNDAIATGVPAAPSQANDSMMMLPNGAGGFLSGSSLNGSVAIGGGGGRADVRGLIIAGGLDFPVGDGLTLGASVGYSDASSSLRLSPATVQTDAIQGAVYARYDFADDFIAEAFASYGHQTIETRRLVIVGPTTFSLVGHTGGDAPAAGVYIGRSFGIATLNGATLHIVPSLSLRYSGSSVDAFSETGGAPAMTFADFSQAGTMSRLGFDADMTFDVFSVSVSPNLHAFWIDNFEGKNGAITAAFAAAPSSIMTFANTPRDRSYGELGVGADFDLGAVFGTQATLSARYDANTRSDVQYGAWTGRLSIKF